MTALAAAGPLGTAVAAIGTCAHCGQIADQGERFCCHGCAAAFDLIQELGLGRYYRQRLLDPDVRPPRPDVTEHALAPRIGTARADGAWELSMAVDGLQCGACVWLIESVLVRDPAVTAARINLTTRRLKLVWRGAAEDAGRLIAIVERLGYRLIPFTADSLGVSRDATERDLVRALAVAGFAAVNVMLLSIGIWAAEAAGWLADMGPATRDLLHWVSALIALPTIAYAGRPFFASAAAALRHGRTNMDVPISLGVVLVGAVSLSETIGHAQHAYFDSAVTLLFFLLIGRVLDHHARGRARLLAEQLLAGRVGVIQVLAPDGSVEARPEQAVQAGDRVLVGGGERIGVDGTVESGESPLDTALVTGESLPRAAVPGTAVFAGTINLGQPLIIRVTSVGEATLLAGCVRMMEAAESRRTRYVVLADRVARRYAPVVHTAALLTFLGWYFGAGVPLDQALLTASAVLIITCPCALALAVPAVQVIATSSLLRSGMLLKTATALERLAEADTVVFDKTGTLTEPLPHLVSDGADRAALRVAASLAAASRHPLARALLASSGPVPVAAGVTEQPGAGMRAGDIRLGSASFCGIEAPNGDGPELWLTRPGHTPVRFGFQEQLRPGALETIARLRAMGLAVRLISGDRSEAVSRAAAALGIDDWRAGCSPADKAAAIAAMTAAGHRVLMAGDGLNDGPALASAHVSASPSSGADISQNAADMVFQGRALTPVADAIATARLARRVARSNLIFACGYNLIMVPIAALGWVTPWLAALAMSGSSLAVIVNSFRVRGRRRQ